MRISDWSSDVWSSDLSHGGRRPPGAADQAADGSKRESKAEQGRPDQPRRECPAVDPRLPQRPAERHREEGRSEEHTSELQSLMRISYAVFCLKKKNHRHAAKPRHTRTSSIT